MKHSFSIVMPAFNAEKYIARAIRSVIQQTHQDWELLVVNDCSKDATREMVEEFSRLDSRIRLINNQMNQGAARSRNHAIEASTGRYISFLDADDWWLKTKLAAQFGMFSAGTKVSFSSYIRVSEDMMASVVRVPKRVSATRMLLSNPIGNLTGAYDAGALGKLFLVHRGHEDYVMWRKAVQLAGEAHGLQDPHAVYSISAGSLSGQKSKAARWHWDVLREEFNLPLYVAGPAFLAYFSFAMSKRLNEKVNASPLNQNYQV